MPVAALVCPHCETPVELQVTAVTRSRHCPHCGKHIMLQFAQKQGRVKRKALLVNAKGGLDFDSFKNETAVEEPMPLMGDAFERMKADPELIAIKKRFAWSAGVVATLMLVATIFHLNRDRWFPGVIKPELQPVVHDEGAGSASSVPKDTRIATAQRPEKKAETLDFTAPDKPVVAVPAEAAPAPAQQRRDALPRIGAKTPVPGVNIGAAPSVPPPVSAKARNAPTTKSDNMLGTLPRSIFRIAKKNPVAKTQHDLAKARAVLASFLKAPDINQRLQFVADRASVEPRARAYYQREGDGPFAFGKITDSEVEGNGAISEHDVVRPDGSIWRASVVKAPDDSYLVDWPSFVAESDLDWPDLMQRKPSQPVMLRVIVEPAAFYDGDFSDAKRLTCLKLLRPAHPEAPPVFAYVERQSGLGREMDYWLKLGENQAVPMSVRVKYPPIATADNQVWLADLVTPGWVQRSSQPVVQARGAPPGEIK